MLQTIVWSILLLIDVILLITVIANAIHSKKMRDFEKAIADAKLTQIMSQTVLNTIKAKNLVNNKEEK